MRRDKRKENRKKLVSKHILMEDFIIYLYIIYLIKIFNVAMFQALLAVNKKSSTVLKKVYVYILKLIVFAN